MGAYLKSRFDLGITDPQVSLDVGSAATDRASTAAAGTTHINLTNPCNADGVITSVQAWFATAATGFRVGSFYLVSGTTYRCRDSYTVGSVVAGSAQTLQVKFDIKAGDFIGAYWASGTIELDASGASGIVSSDSAAEFIDPGDSTTYTLAAGDTMSLYGSYANAGTVGLMCVKDKTNTPIYAEMDTPLLADQFFTGTPDQSYINPETELPLGQSDWRSGFGLEYADPNDALRYYSSIGADLRYRNQAMAGPISTATTEPTIPAPAIVNADMELTTGWTGGARSNTQAHAGTYSWKVTSGGGAIAVTQDIAWDADYKNCYFTFTCWVHFTGAGNVARILLDDTIGATSSSYHTGGGAWEQLTVTRRLSTTASRLQMQLQIDSPGEAYFDDAAFTIYPIMGTCVRFKEFNDALYRTSGNVLLKLNAGGTAFDTVGSFPATITDIEVFSDSKLYIAQGLSADYWEMTTAEAFTVNTLANNNMKYLCFVRTTVDTMYGSDGVNTIRSTTNPANGGTAWSAQTTVGSSYHEITRLIEKSGALYIMKEDQPYYLNSAGAVQNDLAPELQTNTKSTNNGKNAFIWQSNLYINWSDSTLLENDGSSNTFRSPALYATNLTDFSGDVQALTGDNAYLFAVIDNSTKVEILAGRQETVNNSTSWVWHPINETTLTGCETAYISTVYQKRLWFSSTNSANSIYYIPLPLSYANITADANRSFLTASYFITPYYHGNFRLTKKAFIKVQVTLGHAYDADIYWTGAYQKLGDSAWTTIGNFIGTSTDRNPILYIPADSSSVNPISTMMRFKFTAATDDVQKTPILTSYNVTSVLYPDRKSVINCKVRCAEEITTKDSTSDKNSYDTIVTVLDNAKNATWPVTIKDIDGNSKFAKFLPLSNSSRYDIIKDEKGREIERHYNLQMLVTALS